MKTPPWLLVTPGLIADGAVITLDTAQGRHATGPLRLHSGDEVVLADGQGYTAPARLLVTGKTSVTAEVVTSRIMQPPEGEGITLLLALIDGKAMDWAVQKAVEIGIRRLQPIVTDRTQPGRREASARVDRLRHIALQAIKQCHRPWAMEILDMKPLATVVAQCGVVCGVVADRDGATIAGLPASAGRFLAIGPEGGFSPGEQQLFTDQGWARLRLGANILRAETAAVVGGAMMVARDDGGISNG